MESIATAKVIKPRKKFTRLRTTKNAESAMDFCWEKYLWDMLAVVARFSTRSAILGNSIKYYNHHQILTVRVSADLNLCIHLLVLNIKHK